MTDDELNRIESQYGDAENPLIIKLVIERTKLLDALWVCKKELADYRRELASRNIASPGGLNIGEDYAKKIIKEVAE